MDEFFAVYNQHDEKAFAALWDDPAIQFTSKTEGKAAFEELIKGLFDRHERSIQAKELEELGLDFITTDVALIRERLEFTKRYDGEGNPTPDRKADIAWVLVKKNGKWLISAVLERDMVE